MNGLAVTPPMIGRLLGRPRMWAFRQVDAGRYGPTTRQNGVLFADLAGVENAACRTFSDENIAFAVNSQPDRLLIISTETEDANSTLTGL
jgi:hypothetical protein